MRGLSLLCVLLLAFSFTFAALLTLNLAFAAECGSCGGPSGQSCGGILVQSECVAVTGCSWGFWCTGTYNCNAQSSYTACGYAPTCSWADNDNDCTSDTCASSCAYRNYYCSSSNCLYNDVNCGSGTACSGSSCGVTLCDNTNHCSSGTLYDGYTCDGSNNCDVDSGNLGACSPDSDQTTCETGGYEWVTGTVYGNYSRCCGDDTIIHQYWDFFYNSTYLCYNGTLTTNADLSKGYCEVLGHEWFETAFPSTWSKTDIVDSLGTGVSPIINVDLDNDNDLDIVFIASQLRGLQNDGTPFDAAWSYTNFGSVGATLYSIAVGDLDGDGYVDIIHGDGAGDVYVWQNDQSPWGSWSGNSANNHLQTIYSVAVGDLDGDGDLDLISGDNSNVYVYENDGNPFGGSWSSYQNIGSVGARVYSVAVGDLDGDGDLDIVTGDLLDNVYVWQNNGSPFSVAWNGTDIGDAGGDVRSVVVGDLDGDGDLDIVSGDTGDKVFVWENTGTLFSGLWTSYDIGVAGGDVRSVVVGDLDGDGDLDIVSGDTGVDVYVWENTGTPLSSWSGYDIGDGSGGVVGVAVGDFDGDGDLEITSGDAGQDIFIWQNYRINGTNGPCCGDDGSSENFYNSTQTCNIESSQTLCESSGYSWFAGTTTGSNGNCCGDDGTSDDFYNGTVGITTDFCFNGSPISIGIDYNETICDHYGFNWLGGNTTFEDYFDSDASGWLFDELGGWDATEGSPDVGSIWFENIGTSGTAKAYYCFSGDISSGDVWNISSKWKDGPYNNWEQPVPSIEIRKACGVSGELINSCTAVDCSGVSRCTFGDYGIAGFTNAFVEQWQENNNPSCEFMYSGDYYSGQFTLVLSQGDWQTMNPDDDPKPFFDSIQIRSGDINITGNHRFCCGDDNMTDIFYGNTSMCSYGGLITDADSLYTYDVYADRINYTSGQGVCELKGYEWFQTGFPTSLTGTGIGNAGGQIWAVAVGDLDGDGDLDIVSGNKVTSPGGDVYVWDNDGTPFGSWTNYKIGEAGGYYVRSVAVGDLDGDGDLDVVTGDQAKKVYIFDNNGSPWGSWSSTNVGTAGGGVNGVFSVQVGDLDGDGDLDIISGDFGSSVYVWENDGIPFDAAWSSYQNIGTAGGGIYDVAVGDLDGDGDLDIVSVDNSFDVYVWQNNGSPFSVAWNGTDIGDAGGVYVYSVALGDLDGDGDLDIVTGDLLDNVYVWENDGTPFSGTWSNTDIGDVSEDAISLAVGDLDGDGDLDIISGDYNSNLYIFDNNGSPWGSWSSINVGTAGSEIKSLAVGDLDGDGDLEVISGDRGNNVYVWENMVINGSLGPCCGDDSTSDVFYNNSYGCYQGSGTTDADSWQAFCEGSGKDWLLDTIVGSNGRCCGDDGTTDDFYNASSGYGGFCSDGSYFFGDPDGDQGACGLLGYDWFSDSTGANTKCCGDDGVTDDFGNATGSCCCNGASVADGSYCDMDFDGNIDAQCVNGNLPDFFVSDSTANESFVTSDYSPQFLLRNTGNETICITSVVFSNTSLSYYPDAGNPECISSDDSGLFIYHFGSFSCDELDLEYYPVYNVTYQTDSGAVDSLVRYINVRVLSPLDIVSVSPAITDSLPVPVNNFNSFLLTVENMGSEALTFNSSISIDSDMLLLFKTTGGQYSTNEFENEEFSLLPQSSIVYQVKVVALSEGDKAATITFNNVGACSNVTDSFTFQLTGFVVGGSFFGVYEVPAWDLISILVLLVVASFVVYHNIKKD